ncbi:MAG: type II toxin-antitoxin system VapC family toxin [Pyrinomonadaceae bacterium]
MSFWDSSAIVPLCLNETKSQSARRLWRNFSEHFAWRETGVEIASALARRLREGSIDIARFDTAELIALSLEPHLKIVPPTARQLVLARRFPKLYGLRALDSLQLAAALVWCNEYPKSKDFVTADARLAEAAETAGFTVHFLR